MALNFQCLFIRMQYILKTRPGFKIFGLVFKLTADSANRIGNINEILQSISTEYPVSLVKSPWIKPGHKEASVDFHKRDRF